MVKILVAYTSNSGNTESLARAVAKGVDSIDEANAILKRAKDVTREDFASAKGIIAGSPVYFGTMSAELKDMFDRFVGLRREGGMEGKIGAGFATSGHHTGGKETTIISILQAMLIYGMIVVGDPIRVGGHYGVACQGQPDDQALKAGEALGARVAEIAKILCS
jgi:NAD(P)H dehydrogenase (quinone)